jgi:hypothetical protein
VKLAILAGGYLVAVALVVQGLMVLPGCSAFAKQVKDPCSEVTLTTIQVGCESRIEQECKAGDRSCPVYIECSRAIKTWRACP